MTVFKPRWRRNGKAQEGSIWWMDATVNGVRVRKTLGVKDKRVAQMKEAQVIRALELKRAGLDTHDDSAEATLETLVREYEQEMVRRRSSPIHVERTMARIRVLLTKARHLPDVTPAFVRKALRKAQIKGKLSPRTVNAYRVALNGFFAWLVEEGRWDDNPCKQVKRVKETEPTRRRRALTDDELARLFATAPPHRALAYRLAATTGLRREELASLRWTDIDLERGVVRARASTTKNRKEAWLPIPPGTVDALRDAERRNPKVLRAVPTVPTLRRDLGKIGVPYKTDDGVVDFHALRATYATRLALNGVSLAQAQKLMRHCTPALTANVYTRLRMDEAKEAVAKIDV